MKRFAVLISLLLSLLLCNDLEAYIDPGSGSYVLQLVMAGIFAIIFTLKTFWGNIKAYFSRDRRRGNESAGTAPK